MQPTVSFKGVPDLEKQFMKLFHRLDPDEVQPIFLGSAKIISDEIKQRAPRGPTGNLKKACKPKKWKTFGDYRTIVLAVVDRKIAPHAHLVEYGHAKAPAHPFFRPAVDAKTNAARSHFIDGITKLVEGVGHK
jgi:HK97 gp10 family phage protein